jgi:hypothetical protein
MYILDRWLASAAERRTAERTARLALLDHGADAETHLAAKLKQRGRKKSLRMLRLALVEVRRVRQQG